MWAGLNPIDKKALEERGMDEVGWNEPMEGPGVESVAGTVYDIAVWISAGVSLGSSMVRNAAIPLLT